MASSVSIAHRAAIYARDGRICQYCGVENLIHRQGSHKDAYHIDHVLPVSRGGTNEPHNLVVACYFCNQHVKVDRVWIPRNFESLAVGHEDWAEQVRALAVDHYAARRDYIPTDQRRRHAVYCTVTPTEQADVMQRAKAQHMTTGEYLRSLLFPK